MKIEVKLFSYLCNRLGKEKNRYFFKMEIEKGATCADLLKSLNISSDPSILILVNGLNKEKNYLLQEGDDVSILPIIEGG
jgi:sulfur carrier protein ThiS